MIRAILFDFNGVIAADETPHFRCFQQALAEQGLSLTKDNAPVARNSSPRAITDPKAIFFRKYTATHKPALFPGGVEFVKRAGVQYR